MLAAFHALSLRWKLISATVATTAITLVIAAVIIAALDARHYREQRLADLSAQAGILAASVVASLEFNDTAATSEYLNAFRANAEIDAAAAYDVDGKLVAHYLRPGGAGPAIPQTAEAAGGRVSDGSVIVFAPVPGDHATIGSVYLRASIESLVWRVARYALVVLLIGAASLACILPFALRLHSVITNPIEELDAKNAIINTTFEAIDHGVIVVDPDLRVISSNDRITRMFRNQGWKWGVGADISANLRETLTREGRQPELEAELTRMRSPEPFRDEFTLPDGRTFERRHSPLPQGGFVRTYTDISEEKALQDALQRAKDYAEDTARAKSQFLAAMSHEIRTPMNGVVGIVELLGATTLNDDQKHMVEIIKQSGIGLLDVINDILDYSKIEAGKMSIETTAFSVGDIVETTAEVCAGHAVSRAIDMVSFVDPAVDSLLLGDPVRIRQIILNLMSNAVKFTERGAVRLEVTPADVTDTTMTVLFEITDTGIGIDRDRQEQLFKAFQQADYSTTRRYGGTGLGLSICKNLVELMGGQIGLQSVVGAGSTFWFKIPFKRVPAAERPDPYRTYREVLAGLSILVCDTIMPSRKTAVYLRAAGVDVAEVSNIGDIPGVMAAQARNGRPFRIAVVRVRVGDDRALAAVEDLARHDPMGGAKFVILAPHMSSSIAQMPLRSRLPHVVPSPMRRAKFYTAVALAAGRPIEADVRAIMSPDLSFTPPSIEQAAAEGALLLVAEDNKTNQFVIQSQLQRLGFAAEFVSDGREAWDLLQNRKGRHALLLTDCHMPFIDGYRLTGLIRDREQGQDQRLPIVALTANALDGEREICRAAGMDDYLAKPTTLPALDAMIDKWLPRATALRREVVAGSDAPIAEQTLSRPAAPAERPAAVPEKPAAAARLPRHGAAVDAAGLQAFLASIDPKGTGNVLRVFLQTEMHLPEKLTALVERRDAPGLTEMAHSAKGTAAALCADPLRRLCAELEMLGRAEDFDGAIEIVPRIAEEFNAVRQFIETLLGSYTTAGTPSR